MTRWLPLAVVLGVCIGARAHARVGPAGAPAEVPTGWKKPVRAVAIDPAGRFLAAGGDSKQLLLYDLPKRRTLWVSSTQGPVTALAFSPDGKLLALGWQGREVDLLSVSSGRILRRVRGLKGWPRSLVFSPDGKVLAVAGQSQQIVLVDPATAKVRRVLAGHTSWVNDVAFSPDGRRVAGAGWDHAVRVWDAASGKLLQSAFGHRFAVNSVVFTADGKHLISTSDDQFLRVWNASSGLAVKRVRGPGIICLALARKAAVLVGGTYRGRLLYLQPDKLQPGRVIQAHRGQLFAVAVSSSGRLVATGGRDGKVKLWRVK
ncbi:MAG: WD40 repeat domain-containing protein [bacterium]